MRYSHALHQASHLNHPKSHRRQRLLSLLFLVVVISILFLFSQAHAINWGSFYSFFTVSLVRVVIAYFIAAVIAVILAFLATKNHFIETLLLPVLDVAQSFPSFALLPFLIVVFGKSSVAVIIILAINIIWPILFTLIGAIKTSREDLADAAMIFGANGWRRLIFFRLPSVLPAFVAGSIIGWGESWDVIVGAEIIAQVGGIGAFLGNISQNGNLSLLALAVSMYLLLIFILNQLIWIPLLNVSTRYQNE
jgi:taurine transport system permease protein